MGAIDEKLLKDMVDWLGPSLSSSTSRIRDIGTVMLKEDLTSSILKSLLDDQGKGTQSLMLALSELPLKPPLTVGEKMKIAFSVEKASTAHVTITDCNDDTCT